MDLVTVNVGRKKTRVLRMRHDLGFEKVGGVKEMSMISRGFGIWRRGRRRGEKERVNGGVVIVGGGGGVVSAGMSSSQDRHDHERG